MLYHHCTRSTIIPIPTPIDVNDAKKKNDNDTKKKIKVCFTQNESIRNIWRNCYNIAMTYPTFLHPELRHI